MAANVLPTYNQNPYKKGKRSHQVILFAVQPCHANLLNTMSFISIQVLLALASTLNSEGYVDAPLDELSYRLQRTRSYVNKGILELAQCDIIRKKKRGQYWVNPSFFRPALIEV